MTEYHKIQTIFKRDMTSKNKTLMEGEWTTEEFKYLSKNEWIFTEKVDGTNIRIIFKDGQISFGGRTDSAQIPAKLLNELNNIFLPIQEKISKKFPSGVVLYGEGYGAKIQKGGGNYRDDQGFVLFDAFIGGYWLRRESLEDIANDLGIDIVPVIGVGTLYDAVDMAKCGITSEWGNFSAEGIVARPCVEVKARNGDRLIAKIKSRDFDRL